MIHLVRVGWRVDTNKMQYRLDSLNPQTQESVRTNALSVSIRHGTYPPSESLMQAGLERLTD